jgi:hypothetical protein
MLEFLAQYVPKNGSPMCGNTIGQDRRFLVKYMPKLEAFFHYRNLDVSTLKELAKRWRPEVYSSFKQAAGPHRAGRRARIDRGTGALPGTLPAPGGIAAEPLGENTELCDNRCLRGAPRARNPPHLPSCTWLAE